MRRLAAFLGRPDVLRDLHVYGGLGLTGFGGWHFSPPATLIVIGFALVALGLYVPRRTPA